MRDIKFVIFDLDGVFYKEEHCIKGGEEIVKYLKEKNMEFCFLTNNSNYPINFYMKRLEKCGIFVESERIITSGSLLKHYIKNNFSKDNTIYVLGSNFIKESLYNIFDRNNKNPDIVVLGMDEEIKLIDISKAINMVSQKTVIIASNPDMLIPKKDGFHLECGILIDIFKKITKKEVQVVGKPNAFAFHYILDKFNLKKEQVLMIGDTYETDIIGGKNFGLQTIWISTGNKLPICIKDNNFLKIDSLKELKKLL